MKNRYMICSFGIAIVIIVFAVIFKLVKAKIKYVGDVGYKTGYQEGYEAGYSSIAKELLQKAQDIYGILITRLKQTDIGTIPLISGLRTEA